MTSGRKGARWRRAREAVLADATHCAMPNCRYPGVPLDPNDKVPSAKHPSGWRPGPLYPTVDHLVPVSIADGWSEFERQIALQDPRYLRPAHMACNSARSNKPLRTVSIERPTRNWGV